MSSLRRCPFAAVVALALLPTAVDAQEAGLDGSGASTGAPATNGSASAVTARELPMLQWTGPGEYAIDIDPATSSNAEGHGGARIVVPVGSDELVRITLGSDALDTLLTARLPSGVVLRNDDSAGTTNSLIQLSIPGGGDVEITATTFAAGAAGPATLNVIVLGPEQRQPVMGGDGVLTGTLEAAIAEGSGVEGCRPEAQPSPTGTGWIEARAGERLHIRVTSSDFDTVATLLAPSGLDWTNDDAGDTGPNGRERLTDSTIDAIAPVDGWYQLNVSPYGDGSGTFTARLTRRPPVTLEPGADVPSVGYAGPNTEGQVFGLFMGITDYGDSSLYGCADDASFLAQAFDLRGLIAPQNSIVLTDGDATSDAAIAALEDLAGRVGPDDLLVIFYSGHGGTQPAHRRDRTELDGVDETLVFVDRQMTDDEFVSLVDDIDAGNTLLALDACQSGGFAREFMSAPGRMAVFSSDEDVLSSTAEPVGAGGYVSFYLREAILGSGDGRPLDGALTAGELADYLTEGFIAHHRAMNPPGSNAPYQRLIVDRGSLRWDDVLFITPRNPAGALPERTKAPMHSGPPVPVVDDEVGGMCE